MWAPDMESEVFRVSLSIYNLQSAPAALQHLKVVQVIVQIAQPCFQLLSVLLVGPSHEHGNLGLIHVLRLVVSDHFRLWLFIKCTIILLGVHALTP